MFSLPDTRENREIALLLWFILGVLLFGSAWSQAQVVINEVMASNVDSFADPQGEFDDWIELYNAGDVSVNLAGMYLTDDLDEPTKWQIPTDNRGSTTLGAGWHMVIWVDGDTDDYVPVVQTGGTRASGPPACGFHAGFQLSAGGDEVHLFDADGVMRIDSLVFDEQTADVSYGRYPDGGDALRFFGEPTPGAANNEGYLDEVAPLRFSHERGVYSAQVTRDGGRPGFDLTITTDTPDAEIVYALGGAAPDEDSGYYRVAPGVVYTGPIHITGTTCVRAMARKAGWKPTKIYSHSYLFESRNSVRSLPIISLVGDSKQTFYEPDGVMAIVGGTRNGEVWVSSGLGSYNNMLDRELERPVSAEWILPDDDGGFQVDCGLRVHGSDWTRPRYLRQSGYWSEYRAKISLRLYFRSEYGQRRLEYPLFALSEAEQLATVILRAGHNDPYNPFIRDELVRRLHRDMGQVSCAGTFANLFINGEHKGYYNPTEQVTEESCQEWFDSDKSWDVMTMSGIRDGDTESWNAMLRYAQNNNLADPAAYAGMCEKLDVVCFIDYLIARLWPNDWDWPGNNWSAACERSATGKWKFFVWDAEGTFESGQVYDSRFGELNNGSYANASLYRALKANASFRLLFADRLYKHFFHGGALTQENVGRRFAEMQDQLRGVIPSMSTYIISTWVPNRRDIFLGMCAGEGIYTFAGPTFAVGGASKYGGNLDAGELVQIVSAVHGAPVYYTLDGSDPIPSISTFAQTSVATTLVAADAPKRVLVPTDANTGNWQSNRSYSHSSWLLSSGSPGGIGYEQGTGYEDSISLDVGDLMFNVNGSCYIRIPFEFSGDHSDLEVMTLKMQYDDGFIAYLNGMEIARRNFEGNPAWNSVASAGHNDGEAEVFEAIDVSTYLSRLRQGTNILAIHGLNVSTGSSDFLIGATLTASQQVVVEDTVGEHLYSSPLSLARSTSVKARIKNGSTWSALAEAVFAVGPVQESLRISEIMFHPSDSDDPNCEYVELTNVGDQTINLNLVRFTKGIDFTFSDVELAAGEFCLVVKDLDAFAARHGADLPVAGRYTGSLADAGERIELCDAVGAVIHSFKYRDDWFDLADGQGFSLTVIDLAGTAVDLWDHGAAWRLSVSSGGSPGWDDSGEIPVPGSVVINELLANSSGVGPDWIELLNRTDSPVNIGGWFLSDDDDDLTKYCIAADTVLPGHGLLVFNENDHFGKTANSGCRTPFGLSAAGETVYLHSGDASGITGYAEQGEFGASEPGITFGRYENSAAGASLVLLTEPTPGQANADPVVGPIVISEILYDVDSSSDVEYVELLNVSDADVTLYDSNRGAAWWFTDGPEDPGIDLLFPADPPITLKSGEFLLLVKDRSLFEKRFSPSAALQILSWGAGKLDNAGETIQLSRPGDRDGDGVRSWIAVDRIRYSDGSQHEDFPMGLDPWPAQADGQGLSLTRIVADQYGADPLNWQALTPSPGTSRSRTGR